MIETMTNNSKLYPHTHTQKNTQHLKLLSWRLLVGWFDRTEQTNCYY